MIGFHFAKKESVWTRSSWSYLVKFKSNINCIRVIRCMDVWKGWIVWVASQRLYSWKLWVIKTDNDTHYHIRFTCWYSNYSKQLNDHHTQLWHDSKYICIYDMFGNHEIWLVSMDISLMGLQSPVLWKVFPTSVTAKPDTLMNWLFMVILTTKAAWFMCT